MTDHLILSIDWIRAARYCELTGDPIDAVESRIRDSVWAAGQEYKRTGKRTLWINVKAAQAWVNNQPHVETVAFPKASNDAPASAARGCA